MSVVMDREPVQPDDPDPLALRPTAPARVRSGGSSGKISTFAASTASGTGGSGFPNVLPASRKALVLEVDDMAPQATARISSLLTTHHYDVTALSDPAVEFLRTGVQGYGVLHLSTHGVFYTDRHGMERYGILTGDNGRRDAPLIPGVSTTDEGDVDLKLDATPSTVPAVDTPA